MSTTNATLPPRYNWSTLAIGSSFPHWHFCDLELGHKGKHRCMSCKVEFGD